jgi:uncharacterized protein
MTKSTLPVVHRPEAQRFEIALEGGVGVCTYRRQDPVLFLTHTEVPVALEGRGVAGALVQATLDWARSEGMRVHPQCSYVAAYMQRHPETHDLRA